MDIHKFENKKQELIPIAEMAFIPQNVIFKKKNLNILKTDLYRNVLTAEFLLFIFAFCYGYFCQSAFICRCKTCVDLGSLEEQLVSSN